MRKPIVLNEKKAEPKVLNFFKKNFLWVLAAGLGIFMLMDLREFYINVGRAQVEQDCRDKINLITLQAETTIRGKEKLLETAVKEKLDEKDKHKKELKTRDNDFKVYKQKSRSEFLELRLKLSKVLIVNNSLRKELLDTKSLNLSLTAINRNLLWDWDVSENQLLRNFDNVLKETTAATEQKYIDFINKIDRIKKRVK